MIASRRPHGVVYALLALSLAVNLIGAGYWFGSGLSHERAARGPKPPRTVESTIDFVSRRYPQPVATAVRAKLEERRDQIKTALDDMRDARRDTRKAMREEPLDKTRVEAAFAASRQKAEAFQRVIHDAVIQSLPDVPPAERGGLDKDDD